MSKEVIKEVAVIVAINAGALVVILELRILLGYV